MATVMVALGELPGTTVTTGLSTAPMPMMSGPVDAMGADDVRVPRMVTVPLTLMEAAEKAHAIAGLSEPARAGCRAYARIIAELRRDMDDVLPAAELLGGLLNAIGLKAAIQAESGQNAKAAARRWANGCS